MSTVTISSDNISSYFCFVSMLFKAGMSYLIKLPSGAAPSFINLLRGGGVWVGVYEELLWDECVCAL